MYTSLLINEQKFGLKRQITKMDSEKEKLIQYKGLEHSESTRKTLLRKYIVLSIALFVLFLGGITFSYIQNEWVQQKVRNHYFPEMTSTKQNSSACGITNMSDPTYKNYTIVQQDTAHWNMYFNIAQHVPMFFTNMILNTYTDTYGRKFILVISVIGMCLKYCVITTVIYFNASLLYILAAYILDGVMGSMYAILAGSFAYVADIAYDQRNRVLGIVGLETLLLIGSIISGTLSGYLIETINLGFINTAFICTAVLLLGGFIYIFLVPESLHKSKRTPAKPILGTIETMFQFYISNKFKGKRLGYIILLFSFCMAILSSGNRSSMEVLYFLGLPFCWGPSQIGTFLTARHAAQGIVGMISLKLLQYCISNEAIAVLGTISNMVSYIIEGLATTDLMIYMVPVGGILSFLMIPLIRGMMSVITDPDKQGAMFSSVAAIETISSITASLASNEIYAETYAFMHGFVFLLLAGFCFINCLLLIAYYILKKVKLDHLHDIRHKTP